MGADVAFVDKQAIVSVVGQGLDLEASRFLAVLAQREITPRALTLGPLRIAATIDAEHLADATRALHAAFVVPA